MLECQSLNPPNCMFVGIGAIGATAGKSLFVRPGTSAAVAAQSLPPCAHTASSSLLSSTSVHLNLPPLTELMLEFKKSYHLTRHCCSPRPGTISAILPHFLPPYSRTASFCPLSSSAVHLPNASAHCAVSEIWGKFPSVPTHFFQHCFFVRPGTSAAISPQLPPP
jgi:hypothetical protein